MYSYNFIVWIIISIMFLFSVNKVILAFTKLRFEFDYEKERYYIFDFNKTVHENQIKKSILNSKRGCDANIG